MLKPCKSLIVALSLCESMRPLSLSVWWRLLHRIFLCSLSGFYSERLPRPGRVFFLDVVNYAVMSNLTTMCCFTSIKSAKKPQTPDIVSMWHQIHKGDLVSVNCMDGKVLEIANLSNKQLNYMNRWREQSASMGWCMRVLSQKVARMDNNGNGLKR